MNDELRQIGIWWIYAEDVTEPTRVHGILSRTSDGHIELEITSQAFSPNLDCAFGKSFYIWGINKKNVPITLINAVALSYSEYGVQTIRASYALVGMHIKSVDEVCVNSACAHYPYLSDFYFYNRINIGENSDNYTISVDKSQNSNSRIIRLDNNSSWELRCAWSFSANHAFKKVCVSQESYFWVHCNEEVSLTTLNRNIKEFTELLSFSFMREQNPDEITFYRKDNPDHKITLYFKKEENVKPISNLFNEKFSQSQLDEVICNWHNCFKQLHPVYISLERAGNRSKGIGAVPEFLHAEFAAEGYFKRFHQNGGPKKEKVYCEKILRELLSFFNSVDIIRNMNLNLKRINETRNAYVHLYDYNEEVYTQPHDLWIVTEKLRILVTCCVLYKLGLSFDEINKRIQSARILLPEAYSINNWF